MRKRMTVVYCLLTLAMTMMIYRIYFIDTADYITASAQGKYGLNISSSRGTIYDRNMKKLVNAATEYVAAVMPTPQALAALGDIVPEEDRLPLGERMQAGLPFRMDVDDNEIYVHGVDIFSVPVRYPEAGAQLAPHLIGYLSGDDSKGVSGIEKAYDEWLTKMGGRVDVGFSVDAAGHLMPGAAIEVRRKNDTTAGGIVLALDADIQAVTQQALEYGCEKGAAVVMDVYTGEILGMHSIPTFDQNDISASLESEDAPFISRAVSGYNIGSVFKIIVAAAALESGVGEYHEHTCEGYIDIEGQIFRCNNNAVHGTIDMRAALQKSCNTYFISLVEQIGPERVLALCENLGIGTAAEIAPGLYTQKGNLPTMAELKNPIAQANFSFGQGSSLATPLQMAQSISTLINSGVAITPKAVLGTTEDGVIIKDRTPGYTPVQVVSEDTSRRIKELMTSVVSDGSGRTAMPFVGGAGGKTSSAQTGQLVDGKEIVHAWFGGFYPAKQPKYSIVIFVEGGESGEQIAAPIFKNIANGIALLDAK